MGFERNYHHAPKYGEKEYDEAKPATIKFKLVMVEEEEDFTCKLQEIQDTYQPEQIFIEYNGTWGMDKQA